MHVSDLLEWEGDWKALQNRDLACSEDSRQEGRRGRWNIQDWDVGVCTVTQEEPGLEMALGVAAWQRG